MSDTIPTQFTVPIGEFMRVAAQRDALRERLAEVEKDAARLDWLEEGMVSYGDGYTELRECGVTFQWQQSVDCPTFPGLRAAIDVAMQETAP